MTVGTVRQLVSRGPPRKLATWPAGQLIYTGVAQLMEGPLALETLPGRHLILLNYENYIIAPLVELSFVNSC